MAQIDLFLNELLERKGSDLHLSAEMPPLVRKDGDLLSLEADPLSHDVLRNMILEILPGLFGLLGFGWIYAGNLGVGLAWLVGMLIWTGIAAVIAIFSVGISLLCTLPVSIVMIVISAVTLNNYTKKQTALFGS